jgi:hypothetical protein
LRHVRGEGVVTKREARPLCHGFLRHAAEADSPRAVQGTLDTTLGRHNHDL